jgi:oligosaccharide repeat unit polymerase
MHAGELYLYLYAVLWVLTVLYYQIRKRQFDAGSVLLLSYATYAVVSILLYRSEYYPFEPVQLLPLVYLYLMLLLVFQPVLRFDATAIERIRPPSPIFFFPFCLLFIGASLAQIPTVATDFAVSIVRLITTPTGGLDIYNEAMAESYSLGDGSISNFASIISNAYGNVGVLLLFYYLTVERRSKLLVVGLLIACLTGIAQNITLGQRGPIQEALFAFGITYFAMRRWYDRGVRRAIRVVGVAVIAAAAVPLVYLTVSRFGDQEEGAVASTYFYLGQQNIFFSNYGLDNNGIRYGDRTVPLFKRMLGIEGVPRNFQERRDKYPTLHVSDEVFIGFVGDFALDFGPLVPPVIFLYFTALVLRGTRARDGTLGFQQLILLHFVMSLCMLGGIKLYPFSDVGGNLQLIVYVLAYLWFALDQELARRYERRRARVEASQATASAGASLGSLPVA